MADAETAWQRLGAYLRNTKLLGSIQSTLYWDQNTRMPRGGAQWRGEQLAWTATELHARQSSEHYADLLAAARQEWVEQAAAHDSEESSAQSRNLDLLELDLRRQQAQDPQLIAALATAKSNGYACWQQARSESDFSLFADALQVAPKSDVDVVSLLLDDSAASASISPPFVFPGGDAYSFEVH